LADYQYRQIDVGLKDVTVCTWYRYRRNDELWGIWDMGKLYRSGILISSRVLKHKERMALLTEVRARDISSSAT
jgi:hypothetical protein